jgi:GTP cyclohydrolase I
VVTTLSDLDSRRTVMPGTAPAIDRAAAEFAAAQLVAALGVDVGSEVGQNTPRRVADAFAQMLSREPWEFTSFPNIDGHTELVVTAGIEFTSVCAHHLLPFSGRAAVGYRPSQWLPGLSKVARAVTMFAAGLQTQENLGQQIASFLQEQLSCHGVGVLLEAEHSCMRCRGVRARAASTVTVATTGTLKTNHNDRAEFLQLVSMMRGAA